MRKTPALLVCALLGAVLYIAIHRWCFPPRHGLRWVAETSRAEGWGAEEFASFVRARVPGLEVIRQKRAQPARCLYLTRGS
jgi:hypothetical protein